MFFFFSNIIVDVGFPGGSAIKNLLDNVGDTSSIAGWGRSPGGGMATNSSIPWRIPWTEEPGRLESIGSQRVRHD